MSEQERKFDVVIFGATGFTGYLTAEYLAQMNESVDFNWAIAGRSRDKLHGVKGKLMSRFPKTENLDVILADIEDYQSLLSMTQQTQVVITTVGPYIHYGESLVKACIEGGSDYVDLTGEPEFVDKMRFQFQSQAIERGVRIVNSCGFDSIPYDLGALFTVNEIKSRVPKGDGDLVSIQLECFVTSAGRFSGGTWHSAVHAFSRARNYNKLRSNWFKSPNMKMGLAEDVSVHDISPNLKYRKELAAWACPFPTIDPQVVRRSAKIRGDYGGRFEYGHYVLVKRLPKLLAGGVGVASVFGLAQFNATKNLLLKAVKQGDGPSEETREQSWFKVTMQGETRGKNLTVEITGGDPGYGETSKMLAESGLCLALDRDRLPNHVGIITPAAAMGEVLIERLQKAGIGFNVTQSDMGPALKDQQVA